MRLMVLLLLATCLPAAQLQVVVTSQGVAEGTIQIALFNDADSFPTPDKAWRIVRQVHTLPETRFVISDLPAGNWAIAGYHDENDDGVCQTFMMIPREPWGLSNKIRPRLSPPDFDDCAFPVVEEIPTEHGVEMR